MAPPKIHEHWWRAVVLTTLAAACSEPSPPPARPVPPPTAEPVREPPDEKTAEARPPEPAAEPVKEPVKLPDGTAVVSCGDPPPNMACIPGGPFLRGTNDGAENTRPEDTVWLQTYYMDVDEVTVEQYRACVKAKGCDRSGPRYTDFDRPRQPINGISWFDAVKYCSAQGKHLPTEAEWEKAARGPDGLLHPWGNEPATCERAIIKDEKGRGCGVEKAGDKPYVGRPWEVGSRPPGVYGLRDMAGNSWEWVHDWYSRSYEACGDACRGVDPKGPCNGAERCPGHRRKIVRGGSWYWDESYATSVYRRTHVPENRPFHHFGFRCAASVDEAEALSGAVAPVGSARNDAAGEAHAKIQRRQLGKLLEPSALVRPTPIESPEALEAFHQALGDLEAGRDADGKVRVVVYGSSSTAADRYTGYLRGYLQARFGDGGPGFVALVPLWRWHRHQEVGVDASAGWKVSHALRDRGGSDRRYGLMGVRASSSRKGARARLRLDRNRAPADLWSIWFDSTTAGGPFEAVLDDQVAVRIDTKAARTEAGYATLPTGDARSLQIRTVGDGEVRLFGAVIERSEAGVVVDELGIGGSGARRQLDWDEDLWAEHLKKRSPDLYVLAYGGIEAMRQDHDPARWERELGEILTRFAGAAPDASCLMMSPQDLALRGEGGQREHPRTLDGVIAVQRRLARAHGCAFFDTVSFMGGPGSMPKWVDADLARDDHVHLTPTGYALLGRSLADALIAPFDARTISPRP